MLLKDRFIELMSGVAGMYNVVLTEFMFDTYYDIFKNYTYEQFGQAVTEVIKNHKYHTFPKPAEILEFLEGTRDDKALIAWLQAKEAVKKAGYYKTVEFKDSIISHCLFELGGWMAFCSTQLEDLPFVEKRFMDLYRLFLKRGVNQSVRLIGFIESRNLEKGFNEDIPEPIKIGYEEDRLLLT